MDWDFLINPYFISFLAILAVLITLSIFFIQYRWYVNDRKYRQEVDAQTQYKLENVETSVEELREYQREVSKANAKSGVIRAFEAFLKFIFWVIVIWVLYKFAMWFINQLLSGNKHRGNRG